MRQNDEIKAIYDKLCGGKKLDEDELKALVFETYGEGVREVEVTFDEPRRWLRGAHTVVELYGRYWRIDWEQGLTEYQEDEFWDQPVEVVPVREIIPAHEVTRWVAKDGESCQGA